MKIKFDSGQSKQLNNKIEEKSNKWENWHIKVDRGGGRGRWRPTSGNGRTTYRNTYFCLVERVRAENMYDVQTTYRCRDTDNTADWIE